MLFVLLVRDTNSPFADRVLFPTTQLLKINLQPICDHTYQCLTVLKVQPGKPVVAASP